MICCRIRVSGLVMSTSTSGLFTWLVRPSFTTSGKYLNTGTNQKTPKENTFKTGSNENCSHICLFFFLPLSCVLDRGIWMRWHHWHCIRGRHLKTDKTWIKHVELWPSSAVGEVDMNYGCLIWYVVRGMFPICNSGLNQTEPNHWASLRWVKSDPKLKNIVK